MHASQIRQSQLCYSGSIRQYWDIVLLFNWSALQRWDFSSNEAMQIHLYICSLLTKTILQLQEDLQIK